MTLEIYPYFPERPGYVQLLENPPEERIKDGFLEVPRRLGSAPRSRATASSPFSGRGAARA